MRYPHHIRRCRRPDTANMHNSGSVEVRCAVAALRVGSKGLWRVSDAEQGGP